MTDTAPDESALCLACGMCCEGPLYEWAGLEPGEVGRAETFSLAIVNRNGDVGFKLPCACFHDMRCTVYDERFQICKDFACKLLLRLRARQVPQAEALELVHQARALVQEIEDHLPADESRRVWERITDRWDLRGLPGLLADGQIDPDTVMAIVALDVHLDKHFRLPTAEPDA